MKERWVVLSPGGTKGSRRDGVQTGGREEDPMRNRQKTSQVCGWLASKRTPSPLGDEAPALVDGSWRGGTQGRQPGVTNSCGQKHGP